MWIFRQTLKSGRGGWVIWTLSLVAVLVLFLGMYPLLEADMESFQRIFDSFPDAFKRAFGMEGIDIGTPLGFMSFSYIYVLLAGAVYAMNIGLSALSEEVRAKTGEFLLTRPVGRTRIALEKGASVYARVIAMSVVVMASGWPVLMGMGERAIDMAGYLRLAGTLLWIQVFFAGLGLCVSAVALRLRSVLPVSMGAVFGFYILYLLNQTLEDAKLSAISPFGYLSLSHIHLTGQYDEGYLTLLIGWTAAFTVGAVLVFQRRDVPSVS